MSKPKTAPPLDTPGRKQLDLVGTKGHCPTCGGPWKGQALRVCRRCGEAIGRGEKWRQVPVGAGLFAVEHRVDCDPAGELQRLRAELAAVKV